MKDLIILKTYAEKMYLIRTGNFWFDEDDVGDDRKILYRACGYFIYFVYIFMTFMEILAVVVGNFSDDEKSNAMSFSISHIIVMIKIYSIITKKTLIKNMNRKMIAVGQNFEQDELMAEKFKAMRINVIAYVCFVYGTCALYIFDALGKMFAGAHFVTVVTYYPVYEDNSSLATFVRIFTTFILLVMMATMIVSADSFTVVYIIMYKYKFITLKDYFVRLRKEVERLHEAGENDLAAQELTTGIIEGIKMHSRLLRLSTEIDKAFGTVMALQLFQSSGSAVAVLLQMALADDLNVMAAGKLIFYMIAVFFLLGLFMCNAGEITYQASLVSDVIFYCGWELVPPRLNSERKQNIRQLVALTILQAQRPLVMKAFKMIELSYGTFLAVVRATYSVTTLVYAQKK